MVVFRILFCPSWINCSAFIEGTFILGHLQNLNQNLLIKLHRKYPIYTLKETKNKPLGNRAIMKIVLALYNLCAWIFPINFCIFEPWNIFCDTEIHVNFSRCIGLWQEKKCEKVSGPKIKIGYTWQEKNWNWSRCNFSNFFKRRIFSRDSRTLLILFSNFSCMFLNPNIFFPIWILTF